MTPRSTKTDKWTNGQDYGRKDLKVIKVSHNLATIIYVYIDKNQWL